jgi:hypothetical protein
VANIADACGMIVEIELQAIRVDPALSSEVGKLPEIDGQESVSSPSEK